MRKNDARRLDHKTLEELRVRAVRCVQAGESPEVVARAEFIGRLFTDGLLCIGAAAGTH